MKLTPEILAPEWLARFESRIGECFSTEDQVRFAIGLALENVEQGTGGPFGAAIFHLETGELAGFGVNLVTKTNQSFAHAEMLAIANAQLRTGKRELTEYALVSSCEPCAMCFGGTLWSGVMRLVYGASGAMPKRLGFSEGDKVEDWQGSLRKYGIEVIGPMLEEMAEEPFKRYRGEIY